MATMQRKKPMGLPGKQIAQFPQFPPRSSSYRALSIIDAYGAGFEEDNPPLPKDAPQAVLKNIQSLRSKHESENYASGFDIDEAYGSGEAEATDDMGEAIAMYGDDYDPYKVTEPPPRVSSAKVSITKVETIEVKPAPPAKSPPATKPKFDGEFDPYRPLTPPPKDGSVRNWKQGSKSSTQINVTEKSRLFAISPPPKDSVKSASGINERWEVGSKSSTTINVLSASGTPVRDKALPSIPRKQVSIPNLKGHKDLPGIPQDTIEDIRSRKDSMMNSDKGSSSSASSPWPKLSPTSYDLQLENRSPKRGFPSPEEGAFRATRSIARTGKPASLLLTRSNGSTAASVKSNSTLSEPATASPPPPVPSVQATPPAQKSDVLATSPNWETAGQQLPSATATHVAHTEGATTMLKAVASLRSPPSDTDTLADDEASMHRFKGLIKRKPVGVNKENVRASSPSKTQLSFSSAQTPKESATAVVSSESQSSLEPFPNLETTSSSTATIVGPKNKAARPSTPPVLRSPTPLIQDSPSKYGVAAKKSEHNLRKVEEEKRNSQHSQILLMNMDGRQKFFETVLKMQQSLLQQAPLSPIYNPDIVVKNEAAWVGFSHQSLLDLVRDHPKDSIAPLLSTKHLHCHNDHMGQWLPNNNEIYPVECMICHTKEYIRWRCIDCSLRICPPCKDEVMSVSESAELYKKVKKVKKALEETARNPRRLVIRPQEQRARSNTNRTDRTVTQSRPGSPMGPPPAMSPYGDPRAANSSNSLGLRVRPRRSQPDIRGPGQLYPPVAYYGPPGSGGQWERRSPGPTQFARLSQGHRSRLSSSSVPAPADYPPTPNIPEQFKGDRNSNLSSAPRSSRGSEAELNRGRTGRQGSPTRFPREDQGRYESPMRFPREDQSRGRSKSRVPASRNEDLMGQIRREAAGPYPNMPKSAGPGGYPQ